MPTTPQTTIGQFRNYVDRSQQILAKQYQSHNPATSFQEFVDAAIPILLPRLRRLFPDLVRNAKFLRRWIVNHDILAVGGLSHLENPYTELVAWLLSPNAHPPTAMRRQRAWLKTLRFAGQFDVSHPAHPRTQLFTDDGIADLVLEYSDAIIIVETKTYSHEHAAPSGSPQTIAYAKSVPRRLGRSEVKSYVVFLTLDCAHAANSEAENTTFANLVIAQATELAPEELPEEQRWAFSTIFTHLLTHTHELGFETPKLLEKIILWGSDPKLQSDDKFLMANIKQIEQAIKLLLPEPLK